MRILKIQRLLLEKIWTENDQIELQTIKDLLNIRGKRSKERIEIDDNLVWEVYFPQELLDHLRQKRILSKLKLERFRVG